MSVDYAESVAEQLRDLPSWRRIAKEPQMWGAYRDAISAVALGLRLFDDPAVHALVERLTPLSIEDRICQARREAAGVPGEAGQRVVVELLVRATERGPHEFLGAGVFVYSVDRDLSAVDPRRRPKGTSEGERHDLYRSRAEAADRTVRRLLGELTPAADGGYAQRERATRAEKLTAFLREAAAHVLGLGEIDGGGERPVPLSPSCRRRHRALS